MKFGTLFNSLAKKAGIDTTQKEFVDLLATDIEIPDGIATAMEKGLLNIDAAKNHVDVRKAIRTEALNGVDSKVEEMLAELGFTDDDATDIKGEKNSYEKIAKLGRKIKELEEKKAKTSKPADKEAYEKQIADLNRDLKSVKDTFTAKEKEWQGLRENDLTTYEIQKLLLGKEYNLPKEMDAELKVSTAQSAINKSLAAKGFKIVRDAESGGLKIVNKEGLPAYSETNEPLQLPHFIDGALAQNKLLKVNDDQSQNNSGGNTGGHSTTIPGGQGSGGNLNAVASIDSQMKELGF